MNFTSIQNLKMAYAGVLRHMRNVEDGTKAIKAKLAEAEKGVAAIRADLDNKERMMAGARRSAEELREDLGGHALEVERDIRHSYIVEGMTRG